MRTESGYDSVTIEYLYDPLCGWCYGALPALKALSERFDPIRLCPTGLFSGNGAIPMGPGFAKTAKSNDARIARLSGQEFSDRYFDKILCAATGTVDSGSATLLLTAVHLIEPASEIEALRIIQEERYVRGGDITKIEPLDQLMRKSGFSSSADLLRDQPMKVDSARAGRISRAEKLMRILGVSGVPTLIANGADGPKIINTNTLYNNSTELVNLIRAA